MRSSAGSSGKSIACNMAAGRKENGDRAMDVFKFGLWYWKKYAAGGILTKAMSCVALGADLLLPLITSMFINYVMQDNPPADDNSLSFLLSGKYGAIHSMELFWTLAILFVGLILLKEITVYIRNIINQKLGLGLETDLRRATFHKLMELDSDTISRYNTGELLTILNSDTIMFKELFCRIIPHMFDAVFVLVTAILLLAGINPYLLIIPVILIPFFATALLRFRKLAKQNFTLIRANNSNMSLTVQENIEAVRLARSFTNEKLEKEKERLWKMKEYERQYRYMGYVCGIDEAGRGPLAGPVVAGAVILPEDCEILWLNDSKQLSEKKREVLYDEIMEKAVAAEVGIVESGKIDEINILQATYEAMRQAVNKLSVRPQVLLNDAVTIPGLDIRQIPIIKGDAKSLSIAAASVIAKVTRDRLMKKYDESMPEYGFASHKGYGSAAHIEAIKKYGPSPIHRQSFISNFL